MAKDKGITKVEAQAASLALPDHLKAQPAFGLENVKKFVTPPFLKIVQKQSDDDLQALFPRGTVVMMPNKVEVVPMGTSFDFTPVFSYTEYIQWAPIEMKGKMPAILQRSTDPQSKLAMKAQNRETWKEKIKHGDAEVVVRNVEHINFILKVHKPNPIADEGLVIISFSRGEHKTGRSFCGLVKSRKAAICAGVYTAVINPETTRKNEMGSWHGFDITNAEQPWVDAPTFEALKVLHEEAVKAHAEGLLRAAYDVEDPEEDPAATAATGTSGKSEY